MNNLPIRSSLQVLLLGVVVVGVAHGEPPMSVDDAGTLEAGGKKVELSWNKEQKLRAWDALVGFSPVSSLEIGVAVDRARDHETRERDRGGKLSLKWVPIQPESGWALGTLVEWSPRRYRNPEEGVKESYHEWQVLALATYRFEEQKFHLNLGAARDTLESKTRTLWGVGYEYPLTPSLAALAQYYGEEGSSPTRGVGLRWTVAEGMKVGVMADRTTGSDRHNLFTLSWAWEF